MNAEFVLSVRRLGRWRRRLLALTAVFLAQVWLRALPQNGTPAAPLEFTQLLQAPSGAKATWQDLRGKVVVLEFWSTRCGPCVAEIPHLNRLAASLDPAKFQLISVDDEDPNVVEKFLGKRKMAGWAGIDTTHGVFSRYGVITRPTTIIVDGKGRIAGVTYPEWLKATDLEALAAGKEVKFDPLYSAASNGESAQSQGKPFFEISLGKAAPDEKKWMSSGSAGTEFHAWDAEGLLLYVYNIGKDRIELSSPLVEGKYDLRFAFGDVPDSVTVPMLQEAITEGLHLDVHWKTETRTVWLLRKSHAGKSLLPPATLAGGFARIYGNGELTLVNEPMDDLADALEDAINTPVINETGLTGKYDVNLVLAPGNAKEATVALRKYGLDLVQAERPIKILEVGARKEKP